MVLWSIWLLPWTPEFHRWTLSQSCYFILSCCVIGKKEDFVLCRLLFTICRSVLHTSLNFTYNFPGNLTHFTDDFITYIPQYISCISIDLVISWSKRAGKPSYNGSIMISDCRHSFIHRYNTVRITPLSSLRPLIISLKVNITDKHNCHPVIMNSIEDFFWEHPCLNHPLHCIPIQPCYWSVLGGMSWP